MPLYVLIFIIGCCCGCGSFALTHHYYSELLAFF